jgi:hypothetical protein
MKTSGDMMGNGAMDLSLLLNLSQNRERKE